jgi:hypothetical protein
MGYYLCKLKDTKLQEYFGSQTMFSCADNGAFEDSTISSDLEDYANSDENIIAVVDANGVEHFINTLKSGKCCGRDVQMLITVISEKYSDGFMVRK